MISGLESANLKLVRAAEHLDSLEQGIRTYARADSHRLISNSEGKETVHIGEQPNPSLSIFVGEVVYQLRSALDHLVFDLVKMNPANVQLPLKWDERCAFPLLTKIPNSKPAYNCFSTLPGISEAAFAFIEGVQPYHRVGTASAMRVLADLSNIDKHRYPHVTVGKITVYRHYQLRDGSRYDSGRGGFEHGAEVDPPDSGIYGVVNVKTSLFPYVTFDEPTVGAGMDTLEVEHVLKFCLDQFTSVIIPTFDQLLKNP